MKSSYPIKLLIDNAWLPEREVVLKRFRELVIDRTTSFGRGREEAAPSSAATT